jgi:hypothetical protein
MILRRLLAVLLAGSAGVLANALFAGLFVNAALLVPLLTTPARYALGVLFVLPVPTFYCLGLGAWGSALALAFLTLAPSLLAKLGLGALTPWPLVLALNFVYALTALVVYRLVAGARAPSGPPGRD